MSFSLGRIGQVALAVRDVDRAEAFYGKTLIDDTNTCPVPWGRLEQL